MVRNEVGDAGLFLSFADLAIMPTGGHHPVTPLGEQQQGRSVPTSSVLLAPLLALHG